MSLKFVYALVSSENDYYAEQALISMHSLRLHNPDACIVLVTDSATLNTLTGNRAQIKDYVNEYVTVNPPAEFTPVQKSRFIKTSLRQNVKGDFLYIDNDTIIVDSLCELEDLDCEMGAVLDLHTTADNNVQLNWYLKHTKKEFWGYNRYFNGGVLFVRDTENTHKLFADWHRLWNEERDKYGINKDQPTFAQADTACNHLVREIDGRYNCQIVTPGAKKYFFDPLIIHYMSDWRCFQYFPLKNTEFLKQIRENGITTDVENIVNNPQLAFLESSWIFGDEERELYRSPVVIVSRIISRNYKWTNKVVRFIGRLFGYKV